MEAAARQDRRLLSVGGGLSTQVLSSSLCEDPDLRKIIYRAASLFYPNRNVVLWNIADLDSISFHLNCH